MIKPASDNEYLVFHIEGGLGKNILATAVIEAVKKQYPEKKLIVVTAWEEPWYHNPNVYRVYKFGSLSYFYDDFIFDNTKIFRIDPYHTEGYLLRKKHLAEVWCDLYDVKFDNNQPKLYLTSREIESAKEKLKLDNRPILLIQTNGGAPNQPSKHSWSRDIPITTAQQIADLYVKNGWRVVHNRRDDQPQLLNVDYMNLPFRETFAVCLFSQKRLLIDSFLQHACAALGLPSVVCWSETEPSVFGYKMHKNILPSAKKKSEFSKYAYLEKHDITGNMHDFPYENIEIFDPNLIIDHLEGRK